MTELEKFLSFGNLNNIDDIQLHFNQVSLKLFSNYSLQLKNNKLFYITDLELYLYNKDSFQDPFMTAQHHTQLTSGHFYVHRSKRNHKEYKQPNFIGLDITCGSPFECFGGLLIRAIKNIQTGEEIDGCAKVLNYLVSGKQEGKLISKKWSNDDFASLSELDDSNIFQCSTVRLVSSKNLGIEHVFLGKREHGQSTKDGDEDKYNSYLLKTISPLSNKSKSKFKKHTVERLHLNLAS